MKKWTEADLVVLNVSETAGGKIPKKLEGIDGVTAQGSDNSGINKNGQDYAATGTGSDVVIEDLVNRES